MNRHGYKQNSSQSQKLSPLLYQLMVGLDFFAGLLLHATAQALLLIPYTCIGTYVIYKQSHVKTFRKYNYCFACICLLNICVLLLLVVSHISVLHCITHFQYKIPVFSFRLLCNKVYNLSRSFGMFFYTNTVTCVHYSKIITVVNHITCD